MPPHSLALDRKKETNMSQDNFIRAEDEAILALIAEGKTSEALGRAKLNSDLAATSGSDALEGNCSYTLGRAAHESGQYSVAILAYTHALEKSIQLRNSKACASIHLSMATAFLENPEGNRKQNLELAIDNHVAALGMLTESSRPLDYAKIQYNMGYAYAELTTMFGQPLQDQAISCFEEAARSFRRQRMAPDARKADEVLHQTKRKFYDTVEQSNKTIIFVAAVFWMFWRFCLYIPFFVQLHILVKFGAISHLSFLTRAFLFLPYYVFIEIGTRYIKRHQVILSKHLTKPLRISGVLRASLGIGFGVLMNNLIMKYFGVDEQFLTIYSLMWAPFGIHMIYVIETLFLQGDNK
jgi:tetratricopeptide (TPR) repeat protein